MEMEPTSAPVPPPRVSSNEGVLSRAAGRFADLCDWVDQVAAYIAAVGLVLMAAILVTEVLMRLFITRSTLVADEIALLMLAFVSFMALGHTLRHGLHPKGTAHQRPSISDRPQAARAPPFCRSRSSRWVCSSSGCSAS